MSDYIKPVKGIHTNNTPAMQPENTYRFALNTIYDEEFDVLKGENGNTFSFSLPKGQIYLGKINLENEKVIFSVNPDKKFSEIGIVDKEGNYKTIINDSQSKYKLNFDIGHRIYGVFRIRRGCGRTIYFTDNFNKPRTINLDKLENYYTDNVFDARKTDLQKTVDKLPIFKKIEVNDSGGSLYPGAYEIGIQYLDEDLNPTKVVSISNPIFIYHSDQNEDFEKIHGSINTSEEYLRHGETKKSIEVEFDELSDSYPYYRVIIIEYLSGTGKATSVKASEKISINDKKFIYTGKNFKKELSIDEVRAPSNIISTAKDINIINNRLTLSNIKGPKYKPCVLQKYASQINADAIVKSIDLTNIEDKHNEKNPLVRLNGMGFQPGEIYSFGIVPILEGIGEAPVFHIPGKPSIIFDSNGNNIASQFKYTQGSDVYPMSIDNVSKTQKYNKKSSCDTYWGWDYFGNKLEGSNVRHHRFPTRKELGINYITQTYEDINRYRIKLDIYTKLRCEDGDSQVLRVEVTYRDQFGNQQVETRSFYPNCPGFDTLVPIDEEWIIYESQSTSSNVGIIKIRVAIQNPDGSYFLDWIEYTQDLGTIDLDPHVEVETISRREITKANIMGIRFSNIKFPTEEELGAKVIGYHIVMQKRDDKNKTILDTIYVAPNLKYDKFVGAGMFAPMLEERLHDNGPNYMPTDGGNSNIDAEVYDNSFYFINPEYKFNKLKVSGFDRVDFQSKLTRKWNFVEKQKGGKIYPDYTNFGMLHISDVIDGSSYDPDHHEHEDDDGVTLNMAIKELDLEYSPVHPSMGDIYKDDIEKVKYLQALEWYKSSQTDKNQIYNISSDNHVGVIELKSKLSDKYINTGKYNYYAYLRKKVENPYYDFKEAPYYKITNNYVKANNTQVDLFNGDIFISPMKYTNSVFYSNTPACREGKNTTWNWVIAAVLFVVGIALIAVGGMIIAGIGLSMLGASFVTAASALSEDKWNAVYQEAYEKGLRKTAKDFFTHFRFVDRAAIVRRHDGYFRHFRDTTPYDDEIQWYMESINTLWFESQINIALRTRLSEGVHKFWMDAPVNTNMEGSVWYNNFGTLQHKNNDDCHSITIEEEVLPRNSVERYALSKMTYFDKERKAGYHLQQPMPELYIKNDDYSILSEARPYFMLPLEYDCCSECQEVFKNRIAWSQKSFEEELTDNFRVFLPNNYKDIENSKGEIVHTFIRNNRFFVITENRLFVIPTNYQEKIVGDFIAYIGTGEFMSLPEQILAKDENVSSLGTSFKDSVLETKYGVFWIADKERNIILFDNKVHVLGTNTMKKELDNRLKLISKDKYEKEFKTEFPYTDKLSLKDGVGFKLGFDYKGNRLLVTKIDYVWNEYINRNIKICLSGNRKYLLENIESIIRQKESDGWRFDRIDDKCRLRFFRYNAYNEDIQFGSHTIHRTFYTKVYTYHYPIEIYGTFSTVNSSFTLSYNIVLKNFVSYHSYTPREYLLFNNSFLTTEDNKVFFSHSEKSSETFYNRKFPIIVDVIANNPKEQTKIFQDISLYSTYKPTKIIIYTTNQSSGELQVIENNYSTFENIMQDAITDRLDVIQTQLREEKYNFNDFRNFVINPNHPIWIYNYNLIQHKYFIDRIVNEDNIDYEMDWFLLERFRDTYLGIRFIFPKFADKELKIHNIIVKSQISLR